MIVLLLMIIVGLMVLKLVARLFPYVLLTFVLVWLWDYAKVAVAFVGAHWVIVLVLVIVGFGAYGAYLEVQEKKTK